MALDRNKFAADLEQECEQVTENQFEWVRDLQYKFRLQTSV